MGEDRNRVISHKHENGRWCILTRDYKHWLIWEAGPTGRNGEYCGMDHPIAEQIDLDGERLEGDQGERGVFGMPGVGVGRIDATRIPEWSLGPGRVMPQGSHFSMWPGVKTALARRIVDQHLPEALDHFLKRNAEYGDDDDFNLGFRGQYVDISRKVQKLKRRWWDDNDDAYAEGAESSKVIVMELIGHLLMSLDYLDQSESLRR